MLTKQGLVSDHLMDQILHDENTFKKNNDQGTRGLLSTALNFKKNEYKNSDQAIDRY